MCDESTPALPSSSPISQTPSSCMTRQFDRIALVKVTTSTLTSQLRRRRLICCVIEDGTLADLRAELVKAKVIDSNDGSAFVSDGRVVGQLSESRVKWCSLLKNEEIILSRMSTSELHENKLGGGIIVGGDNGSQHAGSTVVADGDSISSNVLNAQKSHDDIIISYSASCPNYAQTCVIVEDRVNALLNRLTTQQFDSISDEIIAWANRSEKESDSRTLIQITRLVFEKATNETAWTEICARLCRKMTERISPQVQDDDIKDTDGRPVTGGHLFRKYLLNRCQEDFERGWVTKESTDAADVPETSREQGAVKTALYSKKHSIASRAKRQGLGLIKFIGELFKLQMITERIMHKCVQRLLTNVASPKEEQIKGLCQLFLTVGAQLEIPKARAHMDVYFSRMKEFSKNPNLSSRMRLMLQDVIDLRERKWVPVDQKIEPTTIAAVSEATAEEKTAQEKEPYQTTPTDQVQAPSTSSRFPYRKSSIDLSVRGVPEAPIPEKASASGSELVHLLGSWPVVCSLMFVAVIVAYR